MNEEMGKEIAEFLNTWGLKRGQRFYAQNIPGYVWLIDGFDCLFAKRPEWDESKMVEDAAWMKLLAGSTICKIAEKEDTKEAMMQDMTLEHAKKTLEENCRHARENQNGKPFPWDRGYVTGYADGLEYGYRLLERIRRKMCTDARLKQQQTRN